MYWQDVCSTSWYSSSQSLARRHSAWAMLKCSLNPWLLSSLKSVKLLIHLIVKYFKARKACPSSNYTNTHIMCHFDTWTTKGATTKEQNKKKKKNNNNNNNAFTRCLFTTFCMCQLRQSYSRLKPGHVASFAKPISIYITVYILIYISIESCFLFMFIAAQGILECFSLRSLQPFLWFVFDDPICCHLRYNVLYVAGFHSSSLVPPCFEKCLGWKALRTAPLAMKQRQLWVRSDLPGRAVLKH